MPKMTMCVMNGRIIDITEALNLRHLADNRGADREEYLCVECSKPVRAHSKGGVAGAHFEHFKKNPDCPLSHK
jgi:hypothetical protein